jgi:hypothetical protein
VLDFGTVGGGIPREYHAFDGAVSSLGEKRGRVYCEQCGLKILPQRAVCTRCGEVPSQQWLQLMSLMILLVAIVANSLAGWFVLPRLAGAHPPRFFFRAWLWADQQGSVYGWIPLAAALLLWEFFVWRKIRKAKPVPQIKGWVSRKMLMFVLGVGVAPMVPWWVPANQPSDKVLGALSQHPGMPSTISWAAVLIVMAILCIKSETRDQLLGRGKVLSLISLAALAVVLTLTLVGWSLT